MTLVFLADFDAFLFSSLTLVFFVFFVFCFVLFLFLFLLTRAPAGAQARTCGARPAARKFRLLRVFVLFFVSA